MRIRKFAKNEDGAIMVLVALFLVVLLGFVALTADMGLKYVQESQIQSACDAAALAAASALPNTTAATEIAKYYIEENGYEGDDAIITFSNSNMEIEVSYKYDVKTSFASVLGVDAQRVSCSAAAGAIPGTPTGGGRIGGIFDYLLFQGSTNNLDITAGANIYGEIHSNGNVSIQSIGCIGGISQSGDTLYASGGFPIVKRNPDNPDQYDTIGSTRINWNTYPSQIEFTSQVTSGYINPNSVTDLTNIKDTSLYTKEDDLIDMPMYIMDNLNEIIPESIPTPRGANIHYTSDQTVTSGTHSGVIYAERGLKYSSDGANIVINGDVYCDGDLELRAYGGGTVVVNGNLYVKGNIRVDTNFAVTINGNTYCLGDISGGGSGYTINSDYTYCKNFTPGNTVYVAGALVADENIRFTGSNNDLNSSSVAIVSKHGNVDMTAGSQYIEGMVFAPEGQISLGGNSVVKGNLIAKELGAYSALTIKPMDDSTIEDLEDIVIDNSSSTITTNGGVKLLR